MATESAAAVEESAPDANVDPIAALLFKPATPTAADLVASAVVQTNAAGTIEEIDLSSFLDDEPAAVAAETSDS
jgi:hypothetical protein